MAKVDATYPDEREQREQRSDHRPANDVRLDPDMGEEGEKPVHAHVDDDVAAREAGAADVGYRHLDPVLAVRDRALSLHDALEDGRDAARSPRRELENGLETHAPEPEERGEARRDDPGLWREAREGDDPHQTVEDGMILLLDAK